jgi:hypothetical protein
MSDTKGFEKDLARAVNAVAASEGWGPAELGVGFSNSEHGTHNAEKGTFKDPHISTRTLSLEVNSTNGAQVAKVIRRLTNKVKKVTARPFMLDC